MGWIKKSLYEFVANYVDLKELQGESGVYYRGICPLHDDHNPSFYVYPNDEDEQNSRWVCYAGCGSGDIIDFARLHPDLNCSFQEALSLVTDEADDVDLVLESLSRRDVNPRGYDLLLLSIRMYDAFKLYPIQKVMALFKQVDALLSGEHYSAVEKLLRRHNL